MAGPGMVDPGDFLTHPGRTPIQSPGASSRNLGRPPQPTAGRVNPAGDGPSEHPPAPYKASLMPNRMCLKSPNRAVSVPSGPPHPTPQPTRRRLL